MQDCDDMGHLEVERALELVGRGTVAITSARKANSGLTGDVLVWFSLFPAMFTHGASAPFHASKWNRRKLIENFIAV